MAEYNKKWADLFPATIGNQNRPAAGVDNTLPYETDKFPQHIANDPVRYDKMNAVVSQAMSNDERLNEKINKTSDDLAAHNKDPKAHATGIAGNAATASKLLTPRTISLTGKAAGSTSFDGSSNASINVTSVNADTASKLSTARKINITGNATGAATFDGTSDVSINVNVNESKHAVNADNATHANDVTDAVIRYGVSGTDEKFTAAASGVIGLLKDQTGSNDLTSMNKLRSYIGSVNNGTDWYDVISVRHRNGAGDGQNFGLLMYSGLTNTDSIKYKKQPGSSGWTEERTLLDSSNYNNYAPTKTGGGASGTWGINISGNADSATTANTATNASHASNATKVDSGNRGSFIINKPGCNDYSPTVGGNYANVTIDSWFGVSFTSQCGGSVPKGKTAVGIDCREGIVRANSFEGTLNGNAASATNADKVDGVHAASLFYNKGNWDANNWATIGTYQVNNNPPVSDAYGWGQVISSSTTDVRFQLYASHKYGGTGRLYYRTGWDNDKSQPWNTILDSENYNLFAPTKTGGGASGTWGINISGNAASATNADKVDGYHASDLLSKAQGILPKTAAEVGQFRELVVNDSHQIKLPDGGTWAYFAFCYTSWSGDNSDGEHRIRMSSGIAAGGTVIHTDSYINSGSLRRMTGTSADNSSTNGGAAVGGFCWRIA